MKLSRRQAWAWPLVPVLAALAFTTMLLILFGANPVQALVAMYEGAFGGQTKALSVLAFWVPLLLSATGLVVTFTAGLWNIGVEGQIVLGAIAASWVALTVELPAPLQITLEIVAAMVAGALWAALSAVLKTRGRVHEIFSGLALNNIAFIFTNYLISGPWQPPEGGSLHASEAFGEHALLPLYETSRFSPLSFILALIALGLVYVTLQGTLWGLKLKALGRNAYSAFLLGVSSERQTILAMMFCGALAGMGGAIRVLSWFPSPSLRQNISGGIGFLALLVVMLAVYRLVLVPFIAFFFSAVLSGSITLELQTQLHSSLGGILTGVMVLFVVLFGDPRKLGLVRAKERPGDEREPPPEASTIKPMGTNVPGGD